MREVFLSHASQDHEGANRLRELLIAHGVPIWFSAHHLQGAQEWQDEIGKALERCGWFIVLLTPHSVNSMWVGRELRYVLSEPRYHKNIVPLLFKKCKVSQLSWVLPQIQTIDFRDDYWQAFTQLLRIWNKRLLARVRKQFEK